MGTLIPRGTEEKEYEQRWGPQYSQQGHVGGMRRRQGEHSDQELGGHITSKSKPAWSHYLKVLQRVRYTSHYKTKHCRQPSHCLAILQSSPAFPSFPATPSPHQAASLPQPKGIHHSVISLTYECRCFKSLSWRSDVLLKMRVLLRNWENIFVSFFSLSLPQTHAAPLKIPLPFSWRLVSNKSHTSLNIWQQNLKLQLSFWVHCV